MMWRRRRPARVRDFHHRQIHNPYFRTSHDGKAGKVFRYVAFAVLVGGLVYLFVYSPMLRIRGIGITGAETIDSNQVRATVSQALSGTSFIVIPNDHQFVASTQKIRDALVAQFGLRDAVVTKRFRQIDISVEEKKASYRVIDADMSYLLDQAGTVLRAAQPGEGDGLIALTRTATDPVIAGSALFDQKNLDFVTELHKYFATQVGVRDRLYRIDAGAGTVTAVTVEDWEAVFDPLESSTDQLKTLSAAVISKFGPVERNKLQYVDVRFGDRIFYKWR